MSKIDSDDMCRLNKEEPAMSGQKAHLDRGIALQFSLVHVGDIQVGQ